MREYSKKKLNNSHHNIIYAQKCTLLSSYFPMIFNNFYQSSERMFGMCQNVEIIHQHHHHFYQLIVTPHSRKNSSLSKTANPESNQGDSSPASSPKKSNQINETNISAYYHSKRSYYGQKSRGIELVGKKGLQSFQYQKARQQTHENQHNKKILTQNQPKFTPNQPYFKAPQNTNILNYSNTSYHDYPTTINQRERLKFNKSQSYSLEKSAPSGQVKLASHHSHSNKTTKYLNCHQLKESKIILESSDVYHTKKKGKDIYNKMDNITLSIPIDSNRNKRSEEVHPGNDKDSILTKKQCEFLKAFKTQKMFDDAKSIVSRQSMNDSCINIEQSIIVNRSMDYFSHITPQKELSHCSIYLAKDQQLGWIVCIRLFEFKHEQISMNQSNIFTYLAQVSEKQGVKFAVLDLYKVMVQGSGLYKNIFFVQQPYEISLDLYLAVKKGYLRAVASAFNYFLQDIDKQITSALLHLNNRRVLLMQPIELSDIVIVNEQYKFHSLNKFSLAGTRQSLSLETILAKVQQFKRVMVEAIKCF